MHKIIIDFELYLDLITHLARTHEWSDDIPPTDPRRVASRLLERLKDQITNEGER